MSGDRGPDRPSFWRRLVGDVDRVGWWTLPAFIAVGLAGAVMAGALAVVYYSQKVHDLEAETRSSREQLQSAVDDVQKAGQDALDAIQNEVEAVQDALNRQQPVEDLSTLGLVVVQALVNSPPPPDATVAPSEPAPAGSGQPAGAPDVHAQADPTPQASPSPSSTGPPPIERRPGVAFPVAIDGDVAFLATSYDLVRDPGARAGVVEQVEVTGPDGQVVGGTVHSWDEQRDLALLRVPLGRLPVPKWRPRSEAIEVGDRLTVIGLTPDGQPVQVDGVVGFADVQAVITALPPMAFLRGAPIVDRTGRVVAVYTPGYAPFGASAGSGQAAAPVGLLCERMLRGCEDLESPASETPTPTG